MTLEQLRAQPNIYLFHAVECETEDALLACKVICERQFAGEWIKSLEEAEAFRKELAWPSPL